MTTASKNYTSLRAILALVFAMGLAFPLVTNAQTFSYTPSFVPSPGYGSPDSGGSYYNSGPNYNNNGGGGNGGYNYPPQYPSTTAFGLSASCASDHLNTPQDKSITWFSSVTGGSGAYYYSWNGTDGLAGNTSTVSKIYASNGDKFATLTVTSGTQMITISCGSVIVGPVSSGQSVAFSGFGASCYAVPEHAAAGESVTWLSIVSGTTASTTYAWDGTDGLFGDRPLISRTYTTNGVKSALLTVTNGANRIVAACTNSVRIGQKTIAVVTPNKPAAAPVAADLQGTCTPSSATAKTNEEVIWTAAAIGGTGSYEFLWNGDESLMGTTASTSKKYADSGVKNASVTIVSGGKTLNLECNASVDIQKGWSGLTAAVLFSWIGGPFGFLLALLLAIIIAIFFARRKRAQEEEEEKDHVH